MAGDRVDLKFSVKECLRDVGGPRLSSTRKVKRVGRYAKSYPRLVNMYRWQKKPKVKQVDMPVDSDYAGCKRTRRSTACYLGKIGRHLVSEGSFTQPNITLSSGESELRGVTRAVVEGLYLRHVLHFFGEPGVKMNILTDPSAAKGVANKLGVGQRLRHVEVQHLYVQSLVREGALTVTKARGKFHPPGYRDQARGSWNVDAPARAAGREAAEFRGGGVAADGGDCGANG